jgi:K+-transporting ATPase ATPase B chain
MSRKTALSLFDPSLVRQALADSLRKLAPSAQWRNPVMFVVYLGAIFTSLLWVQALYGEGEAPAGFILAIALWLWFTVLFANFAPRSPVLKLSGSPRKGLSIGSS